MPASAIDTGALAKGFMYELNQKLAADGLSAQVDVQASDLAATGGRRRRRLSQAGTSQVKYTIVVMVPFGRDVAEVGGRAARYGCPGERLTCLPATK